jgi:hypothetical protein
MSEQMHTVAESGTYTSTKTGETVELTAGQQISHEEAVDYGLAVDEEQGAAAELPPADEADADAKDA